MSFNFHHPTLMSPQKTIRSERLYHGSIIDLIIEEVEDAHGNIRKREIVSHPGGSVIVPLLDNGNVIFVRQYRYPHKKFILEVPAGKLEPNEDPLTAAKRELQEETGYTADMYEKLTAMFTTPGFCNEVLHIFLAENLSPGNHAREEGEEGMEIIELSLTEAEDKIRYGEIVDAKTIAGIYMYKMNKLV